METIVLFTKTLVFKRVQLWKRAQHTARRAGVLSKLYQPIWATPSPLGHGVFPFSWIYTMKHETIAKYKLHRHLERNQQPRQPIQSVVKVADSPLSMQLPFTRHLFWKIFENWVTQTQESDLAELEAALCERVANGKFNNLFLLMQLALGQERDVRKSGSPLPMSLIDQIELAISNPSRVLAH